MKKLSIFLLILLFLTSITGCSKNTYTDNNPVATETETPTKVSGKLIISGASSAEKIINTIIEKFKLANPDADVTFESSNSLTGLESAQKDKTVLGCTSLDLSEEELGEGLLLQPFSHDAIVVITHPSNSCKNITTKQLYDIYSGKLTNWKDIGENTNGIVPITRELGSGNRVIFQESIGLPHESLSKKIKEITSATDVVNYVANNPNSIGYVSHVNVNDKVKILSINNIELKDENIFDSDNFYPMLHSYNFVYDKEQANEVAKAFIEFSQLNESQKTINELGAIPLYK